MDKLNDPRKPWRMRPRTPRSHRKTAPRSRLLAPVFAALLLGCGGGASAPPEEPPQPADPVEPPASGGSEAKPQAEAPPPAAAPAGGKDSSIPDDYSLTEHDCDVLGKQYGAAARSDQLLTLNPKLSDKQRAVAEANIDKGVGAIETQWIDSCIKSLAGKVVDRKALNCAMAAKTVSAFKACLGDDGSARQGGKK
jgi:hypothetical protein